MFGGNPNPLAAAAAPGMFFPPPGMTTPGFPGMEQLFLGGGPGGIPGFHPGNFPGNQPQFFHSLGAGGPPGQFGNQFRFPGAGRGLGRGFLPGGGRGFTPMGRGGRGILLKELLIMTSSLQVISGNYIVNYLFILGRGGNRGGSQYKPSDRNVTNEDEKPPDLEKVPPDPDEKTVEELASTQPNPQTNSSVAVADDATVELVKAISGGSGNTASEVSQNGEKLDDAASNGEPPKNVNSGQVCSRTSLKMNFKTK